MNFEYHENLLLNTFEILEVGIFVSVNPDLILKLDHLFLDPSQNHFMLSKGFCWRPPSIFVFSWPTPSHQGAWFFFTNPISSSPNSPPPPVSLAVRTTVLVQQCSPPPAPHESGAPTPPATPRGMPPAGICPCKPQLCLSALWWPPLPPLPVTPSSAPVWGCLVVQRVWAFNKWSPGPAWQGLGRSCIRSRSAVRVRAGNGPHSASDWGNLSECILFDIPVFIVYLHIPFFQDGSRVRTFVPPLIKGIEVYLNLLKLAKFKQRQILG